MKHTKTVLFVATVSGEGLKNNNSKEKALSGGGGRSADPDPLPPPSAGKAFSSDFVFV